MKAEPRNTATPRFERREFLKRAAQVAALALGATKSRTWLAAAAPAAPAGIH